MLPVKIQLPELGNVDNKLMARVSSETWFA